MRVRSKLAVAVAVVSLATSLAQRAYADERADARRHYRAGLGYVDQRRFNEAIAEFEAAYAILPHPDVLHNIARAYYDAGNLTRAVEYLRRYLQHDVRDRAEMERTVARLEARMRAQGLVVAATEGASDPANTAANPQPPPDATPGAPSATPPAPAATAGALDDPPARARALRAAAEQLEHAAQRIAATDPEHARLRASARDLLAIAARLDEGTPANTQANASPNVPAAVTPGAPAALSAASETPGAPAPAPAPAPATVGTAPTEPGITALAEEPGDEAYEERLVTASRAAQSPLDSPNASGIITAQDIRLSGLQTLPDLLRRVAGVDVMQTTVADFGVSARGFNQRMSNKMLVLIDGRSIYLDFLGLTWWTDIFPALEDIERIEVIRGPGSALYGADAAAGVINVITRAPGESRTQLAGAAGNGGVARGAFMHSGRSGSFSYRATVQYAQANAYDIPVGEGDATWRYASPFGVVGMRTPRFLVEVQNRFSRDVVLRAGLGGALQSNGEFLPSGLLRRYWGALTFLQPFVQLEAHGFQARAYWNRVYAEAGPVLDAPGARNVDTRVQQDVIDVEAQYGRTFSRGIVSNTLQVGASYRLKLISWSYLDADHSVHVGSLFVQDTLRIGSRVSMVGSVRGDLHSVLSAPVVSPRGALIVRPSENRAIRLSAGTAFRMPTMLELFFDLYYPTPTPGLTVRGQGGEVYAGGARRLRPESVLSVDLGFQDRTYERLQYEVNLFFTRGVDFINLTNVALAPPGADPSLNREVDVGARYYANDAGATYVYGAEVALRVNPVAWLDVYANYTLALTTHEPSAQLAGNATLAPDQRTPAHKVNVGVQVRAPFGLDFETFGHFVSDQVWHEPVFDARTGSRDVAFALPAYFVLNARVGYRLLRDRLELGIVGTNLLDFFTGGHREHPLGTLLTPRVMGTASVRF